ncbi:MAG: hypothetical protein KIT84_26570 [Labilithrix sp.]|nr:hypothetical protein [Labilithrix sp.]MCW5814618.1 hypothetical protein [Labilithrix sp.]
MRAAGLALALLFVFVAGVARADGDEKARAKEAYTRGLAAHDAHDYPAAARAFAEADTILPSAVALTAALDAAVDADDPALGAELLERSSRPGGTPALAASVAAAKKKLGGRAGKVRLTCPSGSLCRVVVGGRETTSETWVATGKHVAAVTVDSTTREQAIEVRAGETVTIAPSPPPTTAPAPPVVAVTPAPQEPAPQEPAPPNMRRVPPVVVYVGAGLTLLLAGGAVGTGLVAKAQHDDFTAKGCDRGPGPDCKDIQERGEPLVVVTNALIGTSILAGALTILTAAVFTDWHPTAAALPGGGWAGLARSF